MTLPALYFFLFYSKNSFESLNIVEKNKESKISMVIVKKYAKFELVYINVLRLWKLENIT